MNRANYYNYIEEKLHTLSQRINTGGKLNILSLHLHSESFYQHFFNLLYGYNLINLNQESQNVEAIDLIDRENKIIIQVSSTSTKSKIEGALAKKSLADYSDYTFKFISIAKNATNLRKNSYKNPHSIQFDPTIDIYDIASLLNEIKDFDIERLKIVDDFIENELGESFSKVNPNLTIKSSTRDSNFIGRDDEIKAIDEMLESSNSLLLINGIGGIGKSSLANHYLYIREKEFDYYGFIEGLDSFISEFRNSLELKAEKEEELYRETISKLQGLNGNKLLVIDNVEDMESHKELMLMILSLEKYGYKILFTSRRKIKQVKSYPLGTLLSADAQKLFLSYFKTDEIEKVDKIIGYLGLHTLFIKLVAETIENECYSLDDIIGKFEDENGGLSKIEYIDEESGEELTFNQNLQELFSMQNLNDEYVLLLKRLSVFPSIDIELSFLEEILGKERLKGRLNFLVSRGWLIENEGSYKLHQIIKEFILGNHAPYFEEIEIIFDHFNEMVFFANNETYAVSLYPYIGYLGSFSKILERMEDREEIAILIDKVANIYYYLFDYKKALELHLLALKIKKNIFNNTEYWTFLLTTSYHNIAGVYIKLEMFEEALKLFKKELKCDIKVFGIDNFFTSSTYHHIARVYHAKENFKQAIYFYEKSIKVSNDVFEKRNPEVLKSYINLGTIFLQLGKKHDALDIYLNLQDDYRDIYGVSSLEIASLYKNIAINYILLNETKMACQYINYSCAIQKDILPKEHPTLIDSYEMLSNFKNNSKSNDSREFTKKEARNLPCSCGSGLKYKKCCGQPK